MNNNIDQSALFGDREIKKEVKQKENEENKNVKKTSIPSDYRGVLFSSKGKLSAPTKLHFRDYSLLELKNINEAKEDKQLHAILDAINDVCYEEFDCRKLHPLELEEVMATIYGNFESKYIKKEYYIDETLEDENKLESEENKGVIDIDLQKVKSIDIDDTFREPILITDKQNNTYKFRLERIGDYIEALDLLEIEFENEEKNLLDIKNSIIESSEIKEKIEGIKKELENLKKKLDEKGKDYFMEDNIDTYTIQENNLKVTLNNFKEDLKNFTVTKEDEEKYINFLERKNSNFKIYLTMCKLIGITKNGKEIEVKDTLNEKMKIIKEVPSGAWKKLREIEANLGRFGLDEDVKVKINNKVETRRVRFQYLDFLSIGESSEDTGEFTIQFGE